jgi:cell division protein FtsZ
MGKAMMGTGEATGETRAIDAAEKAIANPLLDEVSLKGARGVLINITGGYDLTLFELDEAANRIRAEVDPDANIIIGSTLDPDMSDTMRVSVVATGIDAGVATASRPEPMRPAVAVASQSAPEPSRPIAVDFGAGRAAEGARQIQPASEPEPMMPREAEPEVAHNLFGGDEAHEPAGQGDFALDADLDIDDGSLAPRPMRPEPEPQRDHPFIAAERAQAPAARPSPRAEGSCRPAAPVADERAQRFGFNNLIHRMTGSGRDTPPAPAARRETAARGAEPTAPARDEEDARMEIPAFLRRQAN